MKLIGGGGRRGPDPLPPSPGPLPPPYPPFHVASQLFFCQLKNFGLRKNPKFSKNFPSAQVVVIYDPLGDQEGLRCIFSVFLGAALPKQVLNFENFTKISKFVNKMAIFPMQKTPEIFSALRAELLGGGEPKPPRNPTPFLQKPERGPDPSPPHTPLPCSHFLLAS